MIAFHGTRSSFESIDPDLGRCGAAWFTSERDTAEAFGAGLARGERVPFGAKPTRIIAVRIVGRLKEVDIFAEAVELAEQIGVDAPTSWDEAAELVQFGRYQDEIIREARAEGFDGVRFVRCGDCPRGFTSDHFAIFDMASVEVL